MSFRDRQQRVWQRERAALQILADRRRWQANWLTRLYDLPVHQPTRKETGQ
ncbi:hypothetical protein [Streptomyces gardneri]|uniref:hypothetical protein n=1 Tax=Streptomyces gardneri TaxID=66892 RepID=UPI0035DF75EB